jgi:hypothetical protein
MNKPAIFAVSLLAIIVAVAIARNSDDPIPSNELRATRVSFDDRTSNLTIEGEINSATVSLVKREFSAHPKQLFFVALNSPGGSVNAGIALGRFLREQNSIAQVGANDECASSCVFALAGATGRLIVPAFTDEHGTYFAGAKIGIHRPYLTDTHLTLKEVQKSSDGSPPKSWPCMVSTVIQSSRKPMSSNKPGNMVYRVKNTNVDRRTRTTTVAQKSPAESEPCKGFMLLLPKRGLTSPRETVAIMALLYFQTAWAET